MNERLKRMTATPRRQAVVLGVAIAVVYMLFTSVSALVVGAFDDDAIYVTLGRALASGEGYRSVHLPGAPFQSVYPPVVPAVFAVAWWLGGSLANVQIIIFAFNSLAVATTAGLLWYFGRTALGLSGRSLLALSISPLLLDASIQYFSLPISEPYFMLGWAAALLAGSHAIQSLDENSLNPVMLLGGILAVAVLTRAQALVLVPAFLLVLAFRMRWHSVVVCGFVAIAPVGLWHILRSIPEASGVASIIQERPQYDEWLALTAPGDLAATTVANVSGYLDIFSTYLAPFPALGFAMCLASAVLAGAGAWRLLRTRAPAGELVVGSTAAVALSVFLWPYTQDRFMLGLLPFAGLLAASGGELVARMAVRREARLRHVVLTVTLLALGIAGWQQMRLRAAADSPDHPVAETAWFSPNRVFRVNTQFVLGVSHWIVQSTTPEDRILTPSPAGIFLHTGRTAIPALPPVPLVAESPYASPGRYTAASIVRSGATVIVVGNPSDPFTRDVLALRERCPKLLQPVENGARMAVFFRVASDVSCGRTLLAGDA